MDLRRERVKKGNTSVVYNAQYDLHFVTCKNVFVSDWSMFQNTAFLLVEKICHVTKSHDINFFIDSTALRRAKPRMRGLRVTAHYCAGQTHMYTFLYPYMGIVSHDNEHNVKFTAQVRRAYTYSDVHIR